MMRIHNTAITNVPARLPSHGSTLPGSKYEIYASLVLYWLNLFGNDSCLVNRKKQDMIYKF